MGTKLRWLALVLALIVAALWFFGGPNLGWTKNSVAYKEKDPVTEIEVERFKKQWVPGIDFLGGGLGFCALLVGGSFLIKRKSPSSVLDN
jgi:hypothetical protein